jgi:alpha-L-fucosidase
VPEWYKDAKLGIYTHWGPYSVPAWENEWYPRTMYDPNTKYFQHHKRTWGDQSQFGYKDFIPDVHRRALGSRSTGPTCSGERGRRFAGPVAEHHDGFAMYDTSCTPYTRRSTWGPSGT